MFVHSGWCFYVGQLSLPTRLTAVSGTTWMYEILSMINNRSSERVKDFKVI